MRGFGLVVERRARGSFKYDLKRPRLLFRRRRKHALETLADDAVARGKAVDLGPAVSRQKFFRGAQSGHEQLLVEQTVMRIAVEPFARIVRVQGNDAVKHLLTEFLLENQDFRLV